MDPSAVPVAPHRDDGPARGRRAGSARPAVAALSSALSTALSTALSSALFVAALVLVRSHWSPLLRLDDAVRDGTDRVAYRAPLLVDVLRTVSWAGTSAAYAVLLAGLAVVLVRRGRARTAAWAALTVLGGALLNTAVKSAVDRTRPVLVHPVAHAAYSSFPSGHAQGVVVATGVLLLVLRPRCRAPALAAAAAWVLLMGAARVGLGVHFLSDVLAGYLLGLAWLGAAVLAGGRWAGVRTR